MSLHTRASCMRTHTSSLRAHTELCVHRHAPRNPNPEETQKHKNKAKTKTKETNNLTCFKKGKQHKPKLKMHIKTYQT